MERDFKALEELFDSILEEIKDPSSAKTENMKLLDLQLDKNGLGFSEAVSVIKVKISEDKMTATASVVAGGANPRPRPFDEIMSIIKSKGVVYGIDEEAVESISDGKLFDRSVVIARGTPPVNGVDGSIEHFFDCSHGKEIKNIDTDTPVCRLIPPVMGTAGTNVLGETLPAIDGKPAESMAGENTVLDGDTVKTLISGTLALRGGLYSIINELIIDNDVNASMGVVTFAGTIIVRGNVRDKSVIRAGKAVVIKGYAFGSVIEAGTDITIAKSTENTVVLAKEGFVKGRDFTACAISAGTFIEATVIAECKVKAITGIKCDTSNGSISGGEIFSVSSISCLTMGNRRHDITLVSIGDTGEYSEKLAKNRRQMKHVQSELAKVEKRIAKLQEDKEKGEISLDDENFLVAAVKITDQLRGDIKHYEHRIAENERILDLSKDAVLTVKTMLYSNVTIAIHDKSTTTETDHADVTVSVNGHDIVIV